MNIKFRGGLLGLKDFKMILRVNTAQCSYSDNGIEVYELGGLSRPLVKRKLEFGSLNSRATRAKTSTSKDDVPFLIVSDDDEGLSYVPELKDATACHLKISAITPPAWKNH
ncbi:hypothetical protein Tco_0749568 [Tanacetum coccineum]|uniref:Uncharacterized protein n=1 Tax=Tanacetum coccineum TaxID=301880 RepID=A0ABQ4YZM9_9ASTR